MRYIFRKYVCCLFSFAGELQPHPGDPDWIPPPPLPPPQAVKNKTSENAADDFILFKFVGILMFIYFYPTSIFIRRFTVKYSPPSLQMWY